MSAAMGVLRRAGDGNLGSDYNRLRLMFRRKSRKQEMSHLRRTRLPTEEKLQEMVGKLEWRTQYMDTYEAIMAELRRMLQQLPPRANGRRREWWNAKGVAAIACRLEASRKHRHLCKAGGREANARAWRVHLELKHKAAALAQSQICTLRSNFMQMLKAAGRQAPRCFWRQVRGDTAMPYQHLLLATPDGPTVQGVECSVGRLVVGFAGRSIAGAMGQWTLDPDGMSS